MIRRTNLSLLMAFCVALLSLLSNPDSVAAQGDSSIAAAQSNFAIRATGMALSEPDENRVVSTYGLFELLKILEQSAAGQTQQELRTTLGGAGPVEFSLRDISDLQRAGAPVLRGLPFNVEANGGYGLKVVADAQPPASTEITPGDLLLSVDNAPVQSIARMEEVLAELQDADVAIQFYDVSSGRVVERRSRLLKKSVQRAKPDRRRLVSASALWLDSRMRPDRRFMDLLQRDADAKVLPHNFANPLTADSVSLAFSGRLANKVRRFYAPPELPVTAKMVLLNLVDLNARWKFPFDASRTIAGPFACPSESVDVDYMHSRDWFRYFGDDMLQMIELPYADSDLSLLLILPKTPAARAQVESVVFDAAGFLDSRIRQLDLQDVDLMLPKFRFSVRGSLRDQLRALGTVRAFTRDAEFPLLSGGERIVLDDVWEQTFIDVDEIGTRATGALTAVGVALDASQPVRFHAKHPFLFLIRDSAGSIFFSGRVAQPTLAARK